MTSFLVCTFQHNRPTMQRLSHIVAVSMDLFVNSIYSTTLLMKVCSLSYCLYNVHRTKSLFSDDYLSACFNMDHPIDSFTSTRDNATGNAVMMVTSHSQTITSLDCSTLQPLLVLNDPRETLSAQCAMPIDSIVGWYVSLYSSFPCTISLVSFH